MKIATWNINGIRSAEEEFLSFLSDESPDIVGLQETKTHPDSLGFSLKMHPEYKAVWNWDKTKHHYSGTALYLKKDLDVRSTRVKTGIEKFDTEGRIVEVEIGDIVIVNAYFPFGGSSDARMDYKREFNQYISNYLIGLRAEGKKPILIGDINIIHLDIDVPNTKKYLGHPNFLPKDREWMDSLLSNGFVDTFRELDASEGNYTWWPYNDPERTGFGCMRIDYVIADELLKNSLVSSRILKGVYGSDHCPVVAEFSL